MAPFRREEEGKGGGGVGEGGEAGEGGEGKEGGEGGEGGRSGSKVQVRAGVLEGTGVGTNSPTLLYSFRL